MNKRQRAWPIVMLIAAAIISFPVPPVWAQSRSSSSPTIRDLQSDSWVATDALGRSLPTSEQARPYRKDKLVGIFYLTWHTPDQDVIYDNTARLADPTDHPEGPLNSFHWWGEPRVGYFLADDPWVHRKNLQMLADAGVDVLILDASNGFTYYKIYTLVCKVAEQMRAEGSPCPKIAFLTRSAPGQTVTQLYNEFYSKGSYSDLWFRWDGKPLILGLVDGKMNDGSAMPDQVRNFFTWRDSWAWDPGQDKWQWLDKYPQRPGWHTSPNNPEEIPVSIAGHPTQSLGRSYQSADVWGQGSEPPVDSQYRTRDSDKGLQFAQQWQQALKIDPQFILITGWNEWIAERFVSEGPTIYGNRPLPAGSSFFVDNFNEEFSRDAMPMMGGYGDDYYMQMVAGIRRFKGVRLPQVARAFKTIDIASDFSQWDNVQPLYMHQIGDTNHRNWGGWGKATRYVNNTGRNNITSARVACDANNIYFFVHTEQPMTRWSDPDWMQLAIDADHNAATGWHGYDFVVNSRVLNSTTTTIKRISDGKTWTIHYRLRGNNMQVAIPRAILGLTDRKQTFFDFHWIDNVAVGSGDITNWWYDGESARMGALIIATSTYGLNKTSSAIGRRFFSDAIGMPKAFRTGSGQVASRPQLFPRQGKGTLVGADKCRDGWVSPGHFRINLQRDLAVRRVAATPGAQLDEMEKLAQIGRHASADPVRQWQDIRRLLRNHNSGTAYSISKDGYTGLVLSKFASFFQDIYPAILQRRHDNLETCERIISSHVFLFLDSRQSWHDFCILKMHKENLRHH